MVGKIKEEFQFKEPLSLKYHQKVKEKMKHFDEVVLEHVSCDHNTSVDALSKLTNDKRPNYDSIIHQVLYRPCFENETF